MKIEELKKLSKEIHQNAVEHGWWDEERSYNDIVVLICSELYEAFEEYRDNAPMVYTINDKPEGIAVELADVVIRILDYLGKVEYDFAFDLEIEKQDALTRFTDKVTKYYFEVSTGKDKAYNYSNFSEFILGLNRCLVDSDYDIFGYIGFMEVIYNINEFLENEDVDLIQTIKLKHEYNKTRPYRHGGKKL